MKTTWLIGQRWKCGNICSLLILIGRGLDQDSYILNVSSFESTKNFLKNFKKRVDSIKIKCYYNTCPVKRKENKIYVVIIAKRIHLFPFRTQKLSSLAAMVLGGRPPGRVAHSHVMFQGSSTVEHSAVNR